MWSNKKTPKADHPQQKTGEHHRQEHEAPATIVQDDTLPSRAYVAELEDKLARYQEVDEKEGKDAFRLREALVLAKEKLLEQNSRLKQLTALPMPMATVIRIMPADPDLSAFTKGTRVRISKNSEYYYQNAGIGTIFREQEGSLTAVVRFADGYENSYNCDSRYGPIDLDLVDGLPVPSTAVIYFDGTLMEVMLPKDEDVRAGDTVKLSPESRQIVKVVEGFTNGDISTVVQRLDNDLCEVEHQDQKRVVLCGQHFHLEKGDRVILDASASIIIQRLDREEESFTLTELSDVSWDDIGGLETAKTEMIEAIELPLRERSLYRHYNKRPIKGVLLYGPPGCGKTMLAKATATAMSRLHGDGNSAPSGFLYVKGPEILTRWVGDSEAAIRQLFARARKHRLDNGYPAVIFIDEAESILRKRGSGVSSDMESTIVPMFLAEMDGLDDSGAIVILATNRSDVLDPAIVRDGRIDRKIRVTRPDVRSATDIFSLHLRDVPFDNGYTRSNMAAYAAEKLYAEDLALYDVSVLNKGVVSQKLFSLRHIVNGGMIAGIVDQATSLAIRRDIKNRKQSGISRHDLDHAVANVYGQNLDLNHQDELTEYMRDFRNSVVKIEKHHLAAV